MCCCLSVLISDQVKEWQLLEQILYPYADLPAQAVHNIQTGRMCIPHIAQCAVCESRDFGVMFNIGERIDEIKSLCCIRKPAVQPIKPLHRIAHSHDCIKFENLNSRDNIHICLNKITERSFKTE